MLIHECLMQWLTQDLMQYLLQWLMRLDDVMECYSMLPQ